MEGNFSKALVVGAALLTPVIFGALRSLYQKQETAQPETTEPKATAENATTEDPDNMTLKELAVYATRLMSKSNFVEISKEEANTRKLIQQHLNQRNWNSVLQISETLTVKDSTYFTWRARAYKELNQLDAAILELHKGLQTNPNHSLLLYLIADMYVQLRDWENALKYFKETLNSGITCFPRFFVLVSMLEALENLHEYDQFLDVTQELEQTCTVDSAVAVALFLRAKILCSCLRFREAAQVLDKLELDSQRNRFLSKAAIQNLRKSIQ